MEGVGTLEGEVRELIRRSGLDPARDIPEVRRLVRAAVTDYDERSLHGGMPTLPDLDQAAKSLWDSVAGFGPLQRYFDDPLVEEIWVNEPTNIRFEYPSVLRPGRSPGVHALDYERRWDSSNWLRWYFKPALRAATSPTPSDCTTSGTYASLMFAAGGGPVQGEPVDGQANLSTTDGIYAHLYLNDNTADAVRFAAFLGKSGNRVDSAHLAQGAAIY